MERKSNPYLLGLKFKDRDVDNKKSIKKAINDVNKEISLPFVNDDLESQADNIKSSALHYEPVENPGKV